MWANTDHLSKTERLSQTRAKCASRTDPGFPAKTFKCYRTTQKRNPPVHMFSGDQQVFVSRERLQHVGEEEFS